jgi:hypothetical protein
MNAFSKVKAMTNHETFSRKPKVGKKRTDNHGGRHEPYGRTLEVDPANRRVDVHHV